MSKFITIMTIAILAYFTAGTVGHDTNILLWLASAEMSIQIIRVGLMGVLTLILFTQPPRHLLFRFLTGSVSILTAYFAINGLWTYSVQFGDCISIFLASIVIAVAALEAGAKSHNQTSALNSL